MIHGEQWKTRQRKQNENKQNNTEQQQKGIKQHIRRTKTKPKQ